MTHNVDSRPVPPVAQATTAAGPSAMDRLDRALEGLWHLLSSMRVAILIMLAIAILGVAGSLLMQMPSDIVGNAEQEKLWVDSVRPRFGGWTDILRVLGLFNVFNSILFRLLAAALTISLIACSIHRIPGIIRTARSPRVDVGPAFFEHAPQHETIVSRRSADEVREVVEGLFRSRRYRTLSIVDGSVHVYADRFRWAPFAGLVGHLAIVVIMLGAIVGGMFGYRNPEFMVTEGETLPALAEPGLSIEVLDFTDRYDTTSGMPIDYASAIVVYKDGVEIERHTVRVNDPYRYNGLSFYQAFFGASVIVSVTNSAGETVVESKGVPLAYEGDQKHKFGTLLIPGTPYMAEITGTAGVADDPIKPGQLQVGLYTAGATRFSDAKVIEQGVATPIGDLTFTFERETQFTGLSVARDPGVPLIWIGSTLLFLGFLGRFSIPHKRVWARITARPNGGAVVVMATLAHRDVTADTEFELLVSDIRAALSAPAQA